ncbi:MAG TPA: O-antigen ligase family protein, partial [Terriglobales bacterium]|nr:O-antigen ligase family protein [Terriglobales bacterium]
AILIRRPLTSRRWLEPVLFVACFVVLVFTYSRGGLVSVVACMLIVILLVGRSALTSAWSWFKKPFRSKNAQSLSARLLRAGFVVGLVIAAVFTVTFLLRLPYFARVLEVQNQDHPLDYIVNISAGPRLAYAIAGYKTYETTPLTGVGVGASGLYLLPFYPEWSFTIPEIARQLSPDSNLIPNIKSFYVRLLAETGLPGFWLFVVFFVSFLALLRRMYLLNSPYFRFVVIAGLFAWLAIALRNVTQDSLTFPIMWVILGLIAGLVPNNKLNSPE